MINYFEYIFLFYTAVKQDGKIFNLPYFQQKKPTIMK